MPATIMQAMYSKLFNDRDTLPSTVNVPSSERPSTSTHRPSHLSQNVDNAFNTMGVYDPPHSRATCTEKSPVILVNKFGILVWLECWLKYI